MLEALGTDQVLAARQMMLLDQLVIVVMRDGGISSVHILAEEMAFVEPAVHDDATTCSIILLVCDSIVGVAHIDSTYCLKS